MTTSESKIIKHLNAAKKSEKNISNRNDKLKKEVKKKNALVLCQDKSQFWTTQKQFWQWVRENTITKVGDNPLTGKFISRDVEKEVVLANTVLNISRPRHLSEALSQRKFKRKK